MIFAENWKKTEKDEEKSAEIVKFLHFSSRVLQGFIKHFLKTLFHSRSLGVEEFIATLDEYNRIYLTAKSAVR